MMHEKNTIEERELIAARDRYRAEWHKKWIEEGLDFVLTVPLSLPAIENGASEKTTLMVAGYTFLFSIVRIPQSMRLIGSFLIIFFFPFIHSHELHSSIMPLEFCPSRMSIRNWISSRQGLKVPAISNHFRLLPRLPMACMTLRRCTVCLWVSRLLADDWKRRRFSRGCK